MKNYYLFVRHNWLVLLFGFSCVFWGNLGQSFFVGWYGESIKEDIGLSAQNYGLLYALATLLSSMMLVWGGGLLDRLPLKRFVLFVSAGLFLACLSFYLSINAYILFVAFFGIRFFGQGLLPLVGQTTMAKYFDQGRGKAISIAASGVSLGEVVLPLVAILLIQLLGWQQSWLVFAASIPLIFVPLIIKVLGSGDWLGRLSEFDASSEVKTEEVPDNRSGRAMLFRDYRYWLCLPTQLSVPFMLTAIFIHQDFILMTKLWSPEWMATCFIVYGVSHWLSSMLFGIWVDRLSGVFLFRFYTIPMICALIVLANIQAQWVAVVMMLLLGVSIGASGPVCGSLWAEVYSKRVQGSIRSAAGAVAILSTAIAPVFLGWLIDCGVSLALMFNSAAAFFALCLLLLRFSYR